jgi:hypothetical protein
MFHLWIRQFLTDEQRQCIPSAGKTWSLNKSKYISSLLSQYPRDKKHHRIQSQD